MPNTSKRSAEDEQPSALKSGQRPNEDPDDHDLEFEDPYEDSFSSEDEMMEAGVDGRPDAEREAEESRDAMDIDTGAKEQQTFIPGRSVLQPGQTLAPDPSAYEMLHTMTVTWPCLSFDFVRDNLGDDRKQYPRTAYAVAGTQAESSRAAENELLVLKMSSLSRMEKGNKDDSDSDSDSDDDDGSSDPILESRSIRLPSTTNRIRAFQPQSPNPDASMPSTLTATSLEDTNIVIHDVSPFLQSLSTPGSTLSPNASKPLSTLRMHKAEGYALDWAPSTLHPLGHLLSGDITGVIYRTQRTEGGGFATDSRPFLGHSGAVEDIQWSPTEKNVFASTGGDGTVRIWDIRSKARASAIQMQVSNTEVNVMSWAKLPSASFLLATGADDGELAIFDMRQWKPQQGAPKGTTQKAAPVANFNFHKKPITSIEWSPHDDSVVAAACADGFVSIIDCAVELDDEEYVKETGLMLGENERIPVQVLFLHYSENPKELRFHPQQQGVLATTGSTGFSVFKTISV